MKYAMKTDEILSKNYDLLSELYFFFHLTIKKSSINQKNRVFVKARREKEAKQKWK